jgi:hypothetical protein
MWRKYYPRMPQPSLHPLIPFFPRNKDDETAAQLLDYALSAGAIALDVWQPGHIFPYVHPRQHRKLTITVEGSVYRRLHKGPRPGVISALFSTTSPPRVVREQQEEGCRAVAADEAREAEAAE